MKKVFYIFILFFASTMMLVADDCVAPTIGAAKVKLTYTNPYPHGIASKKAVFSVNDQGKKVYFSKGNLVFHIQSGYSRVCADGSTKTDGYFKFANEQYIMVGKSQNATYNNSDIDYFAFGSSGNQISPNSYYNQGVEHPLTGDNVYDDWGIYNPIQVKMSDNSIQEDAFGVWRTLTAEEWKYILFSRGNNMYGFGRIECSHEWYGYPLSYSYGMIILPDNWIAPEGCSFTAGTTCDAEFADNQYTYLQWKKMEAAGAVFLPNVNYRDQTSASPAMSTRTDATYWASNWDKIIVNYNWCQGPYTIGWSWSNGVSVGMSTNDKRGHAVRLVHDVN